MKVPVRNLSSGTPSGQVDSKLSSRIRVRGDEKEASLAASTQSNVTGAQYSDSVASLDEDSSLDEDDDESSKRHEDGSLSDGSISSDEGEDLAQGLSPSEESSEDESEILDQPAIERYILPPRWSQSKPDFVTFNSVAEYEMLAVGVEMVVQKLVAEHPYNTAGNILRFHRNYKRSGEPLTAYFKKLNATLTPNQHTCVGLGLMLFARLKSLYPHLADKFFMASSEEAIEDVSEYLDTQPWAPDFATEKEHVLVACRIMVGKREGVFLLDPGYHITRVITVMKDGNYPHTGWFLHTDETWVKRDYCYRFPNSSSDYVLWEVKETRPNKPPQLAVNAVYVGSHYFSAVAVTEKRNLVYIYRSLLSRNTKGEVTSGVHFPVDHLSNNPVVNVIYSNSKGVKSRARIPFKSFLCEELTLEEKDMLRSVEESLGVGIDLVDTLSRTSEMLADRPFVDSLRLINCSINIVGTS